MGDDVIVALFAGNVHGSKPVYVAHIDATIGAHQQLHSGGASILDCFVERSVSSLQIEKKMLNVDIMEVHRVIILVENFELYLVRVLMTVMYCAILVGCVM